ncbi:AMP-dependent synthetase and ligase domain containing protein [Dorcoceras hygrometricum]|uniref:AMP-dependent synthetase and ligase domain containing protein n=1 Tax=Dorcoceras hygrometricum TaxID=472368 RepID=A0A2Z7D5C7_9LAMI|nr:AMP-dependent synthetase and ligase domain containing protein [Dorcoceras hygrometricum]
MTSANSVDGLATMTSVVTSSESAVGSRHSAKKRWSQQEATVHQQTVLGVSAKRCRLHKLIRQRFALALKIQQMVCALVKQQATVHSAGS